MECNGSCIKTKSFEKQNVGPVYVRRVLIIFEGPFDNETQLASGRGVKMKKKPEEKETVWQMLKDVLCTLTFIFQQKQCHKESYCNVKGNLQKNDVGEIYQRVYSIARAPNHYEADNRYLFLYTCLSSACFGCLRLQVYLCVRADPGRSSEA